MSATQQGLRFLVHKFYKNAAGHLGHPVSQRGSSANSVPGEERLPDGFCQIGSRSGDGGLVPDPSGFPSSGSLPSDKGPVAIPSR